MSSTRSLRDVLQEGIALLTAHSDTPKLDAEVLLKETAGIDKTKLITEPDLQLSESICALFVQAIQRRVAGEPLAYIIGRKEFYGRDFFVNSSVLCPRPETELIIDRAISIFADTKEPVRFLDLGTGSGCIAVTLALELAERSVEGIATDISPKALLTAYKNAAALGADKNVTFTRSDWLSAVPAQHFDLIVSNPPYVAEGQGASRELACEPQQALYAGVTGLTAYEEIFKQLGPYLKKDTVVLLEIGHDQGESVPALAREYLAVPFDAVVHRDLAGLSRAVELQVTSWALE